MEFPDTVITKGKRGTSEIRTLDSRGRFVICKYLDPKTLKPADPKRKLMLRLENGKVEEYFIVPLKNSRALLISGKSDEKERQIWNETSKRAEEIWTNSLD
jgi:hypothetical protein